MKSRRVPAIALGPSNEWGGHYFMSLYTGKKLHSYDWIETPIDDEVISRVEELAKNEGQPLITDNMSLFEWGLGNMIAEEAIDEDNEVFEIIEEDPQGVDTTQITQQLEIHEERYKSHKIPIIEEEESNSATLVDNLGPDPDDSPGGEEVEPLLIDDNTVLDGRYQEMEAQLDSEINEIQNMSET